MSIVDPDPDGKIEPRLSQAHRFGMRAVAEMPYDWYCPWQATRQRRSCPDCTAKVALDAAMDFLRGGA